MSLITNMGQKIQVSNILAQTLPSTTLFIDSPLQLKDTILFKDPQPNPGDVLTFTGGYWQPGPGGGGGGGITTLNTLTNLSQSFATGTAGSDFAINSSGSTHTFNLPDAGSASRGVVNTTSQTFSGDKTFNGNIIMGVANKQIEFIGGVEIGNTTTMTLNSQSVAIGKGSKSLGNRSVAIGENAYAGSQRCVAIGKDSRASLYSVAIGYQTSAENTYSTAVGYNADTSNQTRSTCFGANSKTTGTHSCSFGANSYSTGNFALACGYSSRSETQAIAIGRDADARANTIAIGSFAYADQNRAIAIGNGNAPGTLNLGDAPYAKGANTISIGFKSISFGDSNVVIGYNGNCAATNSVCIGRDTKNRKSNNSINIGPNSRIESQTTNNINQNIAVGRNARIITGGATITPIDVNYSIALGSNAYALNVTNSIVIGRDATTSTLNPSANQTANTIVIGFGANTTGDSCKNSIAIGRNASVNNVYDAIALGTNITANANNGFFVRHNSGVGNPAHFNGNELVEFVSSARFKENIVDLEDIDDKFEFLRPVRFNPKKGYGPENTKCIGLIAEELNEIFPEFVVYENDTKTPKGICYGPLVALLIKQLQHMKKKNVELNDMMVALIENEKKRLQLINDLQSKLDRLN